MTSIVQNQGRPRITIPAAGGLLMPRTGPTPSDYIGVVAHRFPMDDTPPDDLWVAQAPIAAFTAFLDHPVDWVKYLPDATGKPLGVTLASPFVIDIHGLDAPSLPLFDVMIQGIDKTNAMTVRVSVLGATRAMYAMFLDVSREKASNLLPLDLVIDRDNYAEIYELLTPWFLTAMTLKDPKSPSGQLKDMRVYLDTANLRTYSHMQVVDTVNFTTLAAYLTSMSIQGRPKQAYVMDNINQQAFNMNDQPLPYDIVFKGSSATPSANQGCFHLIYASDGVNPDSACDMISSDYVIDAASGNYGLPETSIVKDYAV